MSKRPVAPSLDLSSARESVVPASASVSSSSGSSPAAIIQEPASKDSASMRVAEDREQVSVSAPPPPPDSLAPTSHDSDMSPAIAEAATEARAIADANVAKKVGDGGKPIPEDATPPGISIESVGRFPSARKLAVAEDDADHAFFNGEAEAVAKMHAEEFRTTKAIQVEMERPKRVVITKQMIERQKQLRKIVTGVVGFSALVALIAVARFTLAPKPTFEPPPMTLAARVEPVVVEAAKLEAPTVLEAAATDAPKTDEAAKPSDQLVAEVKKAAEKVEGSNGVVEMPADDDEAAPDPATAKPLTKKALQLLEMGKNAAAIEQATASIHADPTDANPYLYWGTALMNLGKIPESKAVFRTCVEKATRGPKNDCRAFK